MLVPEHPALTFEAASTDEARRAAEELARVYGDVGRERADVIVALGGD